MSSELARVLRLRHLVMLSVGGTIGSGLFLFVGQAIAIAGPGVVVTDLLVGVVTLAVMACLAEISGQMADASAFAAHAERAMGPLAGFLTGWNYWMAWVLGAATESVAAGTYFNTLRPDVPVWVVAALIVAVEVGVNLIGVLFMGETEFVLSMFKTVLLIGFVGIGLLAVLGAAPHPPPPLLTAQSFTPNGAGAIFAALFTVFFAFVGIEMITVGAEESLSPERDVPKALFSTTVLVTLLFVLATLVLVAVLPWQQAATTTASPFVEALRAIGLPKLALLFDLGIMVGALSLVDSGLYTASRMLFALARRGYLPSFLGVANARRLPVAAIIATTLCISIGAIAAWISPERAFVFVASLSSFGFLFAWLMIPLAQWLLRARGDVGPWRVPWHPLPAVVAIVMVLIAMAGQFFFGPGTPLGPLLIPGNGITIILGLTWTAASALLFKLLQRPPA